MSESDEQAPAFGANGKKRFNAFFAAIKADFQPNGEIKPRVVRAKISQRKPIIVGSDKPPKTVKPKPGTEWIAFDPSGNPINLTTPPSMKLG